MIHWLWLIPIFTVVIVIVIEWLVSGKIADLERRIAKLDELLKDKERSC